MSYQGVGGGGVEVGDPLDHLNEGFPTTYGTLWNHTGGPYMNTKYGVPRSLGKGDPRAQVYQGRCSLLIIRAGQGGDVGDPFDHLNEGFPTTYGTLWNHTGGRQLTARQIWVPWASR